MNRTRQYRRSQAQKHKRRVRGYFVMSENPDDIEVGIYARTPARCSCSMCGNQRKWGKGINKYTIQELKNMQE